MTANLLAHSDLFRAGVARSGAYNRTLTPFGFQNEIAHVLGGARTSTRRCRRSGSRTRSTSRSCSIHGEMDDNSGTFPIQSERFYMALKGHGGTARYVTLPHEAHGYAARESNMHVDGRNARVAGQVREERRAAEVRSAGAVAQGPGPTTESAEGDALGVRRV